MDIMTRSDIRRAYLTKSASSIGRSADRHVSQKQASGDTLYDIFDKARGSMLYHNALQPHNIAAAGGIGGGAYLLGSALNPIEDRPVGERVARGLTGAALAGGGVYLAANKDARMKLSELIYKLIGRAQRAIER